MNSINIRDIIFKRRLHLITGKGGVGKSVLSLSLAFMLRRRGARVLFAQMSPSEHTKSEDNKLFLELRNKISDLDYIYIEPNSALEEYGLMILRFKRLYRMVFEDRQVKSSLRAMPSLSFLLLIGKLWYYCTLKKKNGEFLYDYVVVDSPSTGIAISMFNLPYIISEAAPTGPLRDRAMDIENMLKDRDRTSVHIVTTCEETPVNETIELYNTISQRLGIQFGVFFVNNYQQIPTQDIEYLLSLKEKIPFELFVCISSKIEEDKYKELEFIRLQKSIPESDGRFIVIPPFADAFQPERLIKNIADHLGYIFEQQN